jgi:hypothetical protein
MGEFFNCSLRLARKIFSFLSFVRNQPRILSAADVLAN